MSDSAEHFNAAVRSTAAFGGLEQTVVDMKEDMREVRGDVKHIRHTLDRYAGAMVVVGSLVSIAVSLVVAVFKP